MTSIRLAQTSIGQSVTNKRAAGYAQLNRDAKRAKCGFRQSQRVKRRHVLSAFPTGGTVAFVFGRKFDNHWVGSCFVVAGIFTYPSYPGRKADLSKRRKQKITHDREGMWVFDDPAVGLVREPFVAGADRMIDVATAHIPNAAQGFIAVFSASYFPDAQIVLDWAREEGGGNVYRWPEKGMEGWLCPALLRYFPRAPEKIYVQVRAVSRAGRSAEE